MGVSGLRRDLADAALKLNSIVNSNYPAAIASNWLALLPARERTNPDPSNLQICTEQSTIIPCSAVSVRFTAQHQRETHSERHAFATLRFRLHQHRQTLVCARYALFSIKATRHNLFDRRRSAFWQSDATQL